MSTYKKRSFLEIIFDSCSSGKNVLRGLELLTHETRRGPIFDGSYFLIPLQVGIETKRKIFIDFLETELSNFDKNGAFHEFYRRNKDKIYFVETDISQAYKFYFMMRAFKIIDENNLKEKVFNELQKFTEKYYPERLSSLTYERVRDDYRLIRLQLETAYKFYQKELQRVYQTIEFQDRIRGLDDRLIVEDFKQAERLKLSRTFQKTMKALPESTPFILQAIYTSVITSNSLKNDDEFTIFRLDKGEEAIENFLLSKRRETNKGLVTLVISEDVGARKKIQDLRRRSNNTIFVLSSYGLAFALKNLGLIEDMSEIVDPSILENINSRKKDNRRRERKGKTFNDQDVKEPEIEEKWALRLVEVINRGYWKNFDFNSLSDEEKKLVEFERQKLSKTRQTLKEQIKIFQQNSVISQQKISLDNQKDKINKFNHSQKLQDHERINYRNHESEIMSQIGEIEQRELEQIQNLQKSKINIKGRIFNGDAFI
ncbi:MAG: hypothetical protein SFT90_02620 [Rickettsiales bacterium]|nr:hypothetical protein [Rickettsiales bacterium]